MANLALDSYTMAIFMQIGYTAGYIMIAPFMDSIDRKKLYIIAGNLMTLSLVILGATINPEEQTEKGNTGKINLAVRICNILYQDNFSKSNMYLIAYMLNCRKRYTHCWRCRRRDV